MLTMTPALRTALHDALVEERANASTHAAIFARSADLRQLIATPDGAPVTGDLLDSAGYLGLVDL